MLLAVLFRDQNLLHPGPDQVHFDRIDHIASWHNKSEECQFDGFIRGNLIGFTVSKVQNMLARCSG